MTDQIPTSEILNRAADLIEERGWRKGGMGWPTPNRPNDRLCLEGGIIAALETNYLNVDLPQFWACPAYRAVQAYLQLPNAMERYRPTDDYLQPVAPLWRWNDSVAGSKARVIATLRAVAVIEAAKENADVCESVSA